MTKTQRKGASKAATMLMVRQLHLYVSAFVAPSLLFFAATGALQNFRLPDKPDAPVLLVKLARVHKDDVFAVKPARRAPPPAARAGGPNAGPSKPAPAKLSTTLLKGFFAATSIGMIGSTLFGLWMGHANARRRSVLWALFAAGALIPVLLLAL